MRILGYLWDKTGTDVAKNASDMILTDDNFVTIVDAVKQGRGIYENIRKAIHFLIATNIGEIVTIFMRTSFGYEFSFTCNSAFMDKLSN